MLGLKDDWKVAQAVEVIFIDSALWLVKILSSVSVIIERKPELVHNLRLSE